MMKKSIMKKSITRAILGCSQVFSALIAVLTSAVVTLFFNGFNILILLSLLCVIVAIGLLVNVLGVCTLYKTIEFRLKWENKQPASQQKGSNGVATDIIDPATRLYQDTLRFVLMERGRWDKKKDRSNQLTAFEKRINCQTLLIVLFILGAAVCAVLGVGQINRQREQDRVDVFNNALLKNWEQSRNQIDSLTISITNLESELNDGLDSLNRQIQNVAR